MGFDKPHTTSQSNEYVNDDNYRKYRCRLYCGKMFAILGLVMIATSFLIAISVIAPFKEHHLSDTDCEITKCSTQNETCTKEECGSFTC